MNRRSFLQFLGIGAATAAVGPKMLAGKPSKIEYTVDDWKWTPIQTHMNCSIDGFTIFEEPHEGYDYSIGVETRYGLGGDPSVVSVMRVGKDREPDVQVAEFSSPHHNGSQLVPIVASIARKYGEKCIDPRGPMIIIEQVQAPGDTVQWQLKIMGFTRFYKAVSAKGMKRDGWYSTSWSIPMLMGRFVEALRQERYTPKSEILCYMISKPTKTVYENPYFRASAQSYVGYHSFDEDKTSPKMERSS